MRHRCFPKIEMSFWFFLGLSLFLLFDQGNLGSMCVAAVLLHELGHIAAMTLLGVKIQRIRLTPFGIDLERGEADSIRSELMIHLSGFAEDIGLLSVWSFHKPLLGSFACRNGKVSFFCG